MSKGGLWDPALPPPPFPVPKPYPWDPTPGWTPPPPPGWPELETPSVSPVLRGAAEWWQSEWVKYGVGLIVLLALIGSKPKWGWPLAGITTFILLANPATRKNLGLGG